jgi:hypothetical protein
VILGVPFIGLLLVDELHDREPRQFGKLFFELAFLAREVGFRNPAERCVELGLAPAKVRGRLSKIRSPDSAFTPN